MADMSSFALVAFTMSSKTVPLGTEWPTMAATTRLLMLQVAGGAA